MNSNTHFLLFSINSSHNEKSFRYNFKETLKHTECSISFFFNPSVCEIMCTNIVHPVRPQKGPIPSPLVIARECQVLISPNSTVSGNILFILLRKLQTRA